MPNQGVKLIPDCLSIFFNVLIGISFWGCFRVNLHLFPLQAYFNTRLNTYQYSIIKNVSSKYLQIFRPKTPTAIQSKRSVALYSEIGGIMTKEKRKEFVMDVLFLLIILKRYEFDKISESEFIRYKDYRAPENNQQHTFTEEFKRGENMIVMLIHGLRIEKREKTSYGNENCV